MLRLHMEETNKLGVMPIPKLLFSTAVPLMLSMLLQAFYNVVDSVFVSRISENALSAVSLAFPAQNMLIAFGVGTNLGVNAFLSRSLGEGNRKQVNVIANHAIFLWIVQSLVFALIGFSLAGPFFRMQTEDPEIIKYGADYFRICVGLSFGLFGQFCFERLLQATGRAVESMVIQVVGAVINIILDPIFIFVFDLKVAGAAYATVAGQIIAAFLGIYINHRKNKDISISMRGFRPDGSIVKRIYQIGLPSIVMQSMTSVLNFCLNLILIGFTSTATAVLGVYYKLENFFFLPLFGMTNALVPIVSYNMGAGKRDRMMSAIKLTTAVSLVMMTLGALVLLIFPKALLSLFNAGENMLAIGIPALRIICFIFPLAAVSIVKSSVLQACGSSFYSLLVSLIRQMIVLLPAAYLLSLTGKLELVWLAFPISELAGFIACGVFYRKFITKLDI